MILFCIAHVQIFFQNVNGEWTSLNTKHFTLWAWFIHILYVTCSLLSFSLLRMSSTNSLAFSRSCRSFCQYLSASLAAEIFSSTSGYKGQLMLELVETLSEMYQRAINWFFLQLFCFIVTIRKGSVSWPDLLCCPLGLEVGVQAPDQRHTVSRLTL